MHLSFWLFHYWCNLYLLSLIFSIVCSMKGSCIKKAKVDSTTKPNWLELPIGLTKNILQRLGTIDIVTSARNVCPLWRKICQDPLMWRTIHIASGFTIDCFAYMGKICRSAIDLSSSNLEDITISWFATDELLEYLAHR